MKEYREEAKRHHEAKLHKYGASHEEAKKYAHGGHVHKVDLECKGKTGPEIKRAHGGEASHPHKKEDLGLIEKLEHHHMKHGGRTHRVDGGPVPRLGRGRKGGKGRTQVSKGRTQVNIAVGRPGGDGAPPMPPPSLGAGPGPVVPSAPPPRPILPAGAAGPGPIPPRPMPAPGPGAKHGGKVHEKREHEKKHSKQHERREHERHHHSGHRGH